MIEKPPDFRSNIDYIIQDLFEAIKLNRRFFILRYVPKWESYLVKFFQKRFPEDFKNPYFGFEDLMTTIFLSR